MWLGVSIKQGQYFGRYSQIRDTIYLDWFSGDPKKISYYLSGKCLIDSTTGSLWFIDSMNNKRLWGLNIISNKQNSKSTK
jgi:hypothetical protein